MTTLSPIKGKEQRMSIDIIKRILLLTILVLAQVLVLNNIHLLGCATPLLYVYLAHQPLLSAMGKPALGICHRTVCRHLL